MKITHVRIGRLESGPGYNNRSVALEAEVQEGENYAEVAEELRGQIDLQLGVAREVADLFRSRASLRAEIVALERRRDGLKREVEAHRKIIREHDKLARLAEENHLDPHGLEEIPF